MAVYIWVCLASIHKTSMLMDYMCHELPTQLLSIVPHLHHTRIAGAFGGEDDHAIVESIFKGLTFAEAQVKTLGEGDGGGVADGRVVTDDVNAQRGDDFGLRCRITTVQQYQLSMVAQRLKKAFYGHFVQHQCLVLVVGDDDAFGAVVA